MDIAMDTTNGLLSPQPLPNTETLSPQLSAKRKRDESSIPHLSNGAMKSNGIPVSPQATQEMIADLLEVLQSQDKHAILSRPIENADDSSEPQPKRQRAESESVPTSTPATILARAASGKYIGTDEVISDIEIAADAISKDLQLPQGPLSKQTLPVPKRELDLAMDIERFKKTARELVERQKSLDSLRTKEQTNGVPAKEVNMANGNGSKPVTQLTAKGEGNVVLTLYGSAPTPRQLFSSLQSSVHETGISYPLREVGLPPGLTTTHIVPAKPSDLTDEKKRIPTFGELFTSSNSLSLTPPKPSKNAVTRSSVVGWYNPSAFGNNKPRSSSYFGQPISTGQWLEYNSASKSPESKRKRRDRALSLSGKPPPPEADQEDDELKQLESLFRSAYSSFAPTKDETAAVAPEGTVNRIWWRHIGEKSYERFLRNSEHLDDLVGSETPPNAMEVEENELNVDEPRDEFDTWVPADAIDPNLQDKPAPKSIEEKETEEVLKEISELLETLNSYQRIRNLSLSQSSRTAGGIAPTDPAAPVTPKPTESEQATYEILKSQLSIMISQLPPYAVAKLNSDQLADLSISTRIPIQIEDYKGVMDEDEFSSRAKLAAMSNASATVRPTHSAASYNNRTPSTTSLYGNQYGSTSRSTVPGTYFGQTPVRQPAASVNSLPRTAAPPQYPSQGQYSQRQASTPGYRPPATGAPTYPHQAPHLSQTYGQSSTSPSTYFQQTPQTQRYGQSTGSATHSGMTNSTPQAMMNGRYQPTTHQNYQQRAPVSQNAMTYQYNTANIPRQTSPQKPVNNSYNSPQPSLSQPQRNFSTPTPSQDPGRGYFQRQMSNGTSTSQPYTQRPHQATTTNNNGVQNYVSAAGYATVMTDAEQSSILERNRRHLAAQQGSQFAARAAAQASAIGGVSSGNGQVDSSASMASLFEFTKSAS